MTPTKPHPRRCETCMIEWEHRMANSILGRFEQKHFCPLQQLKDILGKHAVWNITEAISCSAWMQIVCSHCGKLIDGDACDYCGRPHCVKCLREEEEMDEQT